MGNTDMTDTELAEAISRLKYQSDRDMFEKAVKAMTDEPEAKMVVVLLGEKRPRILHQHLHATALINAAGVCLQTIERLPHCDSTVCEAATAVGLEANKLIQDRLREVWHLAREVDLLN